METSTTFDLPGFRIVKNIGVVRGITVRTRALPLTIAGGLRIARLLSSGRYAAAPLPLPQ